jgi:N-acetylneuraminic acid mutarotase
MTGSRDGGQRSIYGIKGQADPRNTPGGRYSVVSWSDPLGNFWLFGGVVSVSKNDLWKYDPDENAWTWVSGSDVGSPDGAYGTKGIASPDNVPGAREDAVSASDAEGGLWLFGGWGNDGDGHTGWLNDLWRFDTSTGQWTWVSGGRTSWQRGVYGTKGVASQDNVPGSRADAVAWTDSSGKLWLFSGFGTDWVGEDLGLLNDLWKFDPRTLEWTWVAGNDRVYRPANYGTKGVASPDNVPEGVREAETWVDADDNLWLFGGLKINGQLLNALWKFDTTSLEWTWVAGSDYGDARASYGTKGEASPSNVPGARRAAYSWLGSEGELLLFGGDGYSDADRGKLNDLWAFDPATLEWTWLAGSAAIDQAGLYGTKGTADAENMPGGRADGVSWRTSSGQLWLFGGGGYDWQGYDSLLNDLWRFVGMDPAPPLPTEVRVTLAPQAASVDRTESVQFHAMVHHSPNDGVVWRLSGAGCDGAACGTIGDTGLYTAPEIVPGLATVTVTATSVADPTKSASATLTILDAPVDITLASVPAAVYVGESVLFRATVEHATNREVTWSLSGAGCDGAACGTIGDTGLYTAPEIVPGLATVMVTATSVADPTKSASATVTVLEAVAGQWAWISGSDAVNPESVYGERGVADPANGPGGRKYAASWIDTSGKLWLFGGHAETWPQQGALNDLWMYDPATREWTWQSGSILPNRIGSYGTMGVADPANVPGARTGAACWTDPSGGLWLFGGGGFAIIPDMGGNLNDLWRFDISSGQWTWVAGNAGLGWSGFYGTQGVPDPSNKPGARSNAVSWTDAAGDLWLFGGNGEDSAGHTGWLNDLWKYDTAKHEWTWMSGGDLRYQPGSYGTKGEADPSNVPGARLRAVGWIDPGGRLWLFGGTGYDSANISGRLNDLWMYDPVSGQWTWVAGSDIREQPGVYGTLGVADPANAPGGRYQAVSWSGLDGKLWLFGGFGLDSAGFGDTYLNDLWSFDPATLEWTWVTGSSLGHQPSIYGIKGVADAANTPGARTLAATWVDLRGDLWLFGGDGLAEFVINGMLNDLWKFYRR